MSNEVTRTPAQVAADINTIKSHASAVFRAAVDEGKRSCIRIGKLLEEAKCLVPHGEWGAWLKTNVDYSESTAQNLMRCYREFGDEQIDLFSGVSDADFFAVLSQSQMLELLALPKERRREFVEEHREELESGEMSVRDMKAEISRLKKENEEQAEDLKTSEEQIRVLENLTDDLQEKLDVERRKPAPEPVVQEVIVNQPSEDQMRNMRNELAEQLREEFNTELEAVHEEYNDKIKALERARDEAEQDAAKAEAVEEQLAKAKSDHKAAMDKLKADHEKKIAELEASYKKQAKASVAGADPNVVRIQLALEDFKRTVTVVSATIGKMKAEGGEAAQKADKLQANVEKILGSLIAEAGWTV